MDYNETTTENYFTTEHEQSYVEIIQVVIGVHITGITCILGIIGNIISFVVLTVSKDKSPMWLILKALAINDSLFLLTISMSAVLCNLYLSIKAHIFLWFLENRHIILFSCYGMTFILQMNTVYLTALVSYERYRAVSFPLQAASRLTLRKACKMVSAIAVVSILYNIPRWFEFNPQAVYINTDFGDNLVYRYFYSGALYSLLLFLVPVVLLLFFNIKLLNKLQIARRSRASMGGFQKEQHNITKISMMVVLVFFICGFPAVVTNIYHAFTGSVYDSVFIQLWMVVANYLVVLNSACNFIIYCLFGKKFRKYLAVLQCSV